MLVNLGLFGNSDQIREYISEAVQISYRPRDSSGGNKFAMERAHLNVVPVHVWIFLEIYFVY